MHWDITCDNVLIDIDSKCLSLIDLGSAKQFNSPNKIK
jgi:serine/threonine protein kinase